MHGLERVRELSEEDPSERPERVADREDCGDNAQEGDRDVGIGSEHSLLEDPHEHYPLGLETASWRDGRENERSHYRQGSRDGHLAREPSHLSDVPDSRLREHDAPGEARGECSRRQFVTSLIVLARNVASPR